MIEFIILVIFFVIIFPFLLNVNLSVNALKNNGEIKVFLFKFLPILYQKFEINKGVIKFIKNPKKIKQIQLSFKRDDVKKFNNIFAIVLNSQVIKFVDINTILGIKNSPRIVAMIYGIYNILIGNFLSINTAKLNILKSSSKIKTYFKYTYFKTNLSLNIKISLYQILSILIQIKTGVKT